MNTVFDDRVITGVVSLMKTSFRLMKIFTLFLISIVLSLGCSKQQGNQTKNTNPIKNVSTEPTNTADTLENALDQLSKIPTDSYHRFLRSSSLVVPPVCVGKTWAAVTGFLDKTHSMEAWENGSAIHNYYQLQENAIELSDRHSLDLWLLLSASPSRKIYAGDVALVSILNTNYSGVIDGAPYPVGSVLDRVLRADDVKEVGKSWPYLKRILVHYGHLQDRWMEYNPSGFHVTVEFCASLTDEIAGKRMYFYVPSGLDPLQSYSGEIMPNSEFTESDTLGDITSGGGNEWWHGEPDIVDINKKKYLLPTANDGG